MTDSDWNIFHLFPTQENWINFTLTKSRKWKEKKNRGTTRIPQDDQNKRKNAHEEKRHSPVATKWKSFNHETTCKIHFERQLNNPIELRSGFTEQNHPKMKNVCKSKSRFTKTWKKFSKSIQDMYLTMANTCNLRETRVYQWKSSRTKIPTENQSTNVRRALESGNNWAKRVKSWRSMLFFLPPEQRL